MCSVQRTFWIHWCSSWNCSFSCTSFGGCTLLPKLSKERNWDKLRQYGPLAWHRLNLIQMHVSQDQTILLDNLACACALHREFNIRFVSITGSYILQVAGWNLIITGKPLALKITNNLYSRQGFLHKVVRIFHTVKTRSIHYKYLLIDTLRPVKSLQSHLDGCSTDVSIDSRFGSGLPSTTEDCHHKWSK